MAKIYKLMVGLKQINDVHYYEGVAITHAEYFAEDTGETVEIWVAEEHDIVPHDLLEWTLLREVKI